MYILMSGKGEKTAVKIRRLEIEEKKRQTISAETETKLNEIWQKFDATQIPCRISVFRFDT